MKCRIFSDKSLLKVEKEINKFLDEIYIEFKVKDVIFRASEPVGHEVFYFVIFYE